MQWLKRHLTEIFCFLFLTVIVGVVVVRNYTLGTFLTGIDNFHIEFDLGLARSRAWSGVWQENQGVGMVSGLAQMTELPRVVIYQVLSWVMPISLIRYAYVFGNLYLGVIGIFFLVWYLSKSRLAGLAGALFYLFNLGTLQVFFMPTEMFVVNYAALPWLFLLVFKYLSEGRRASLLWYAGLLFLFAPMAMTPTIFVVYFLLLGIICAGCLLSREKIRVKWKRMVVMVVVTLGMNMYFLLPFVNFAMNNAKALTESKINNVFSQENYLLNASRTSWSDLATLKGMWFDYPDNVNGELVPLLGGWDQYLAGVGMWIFVPVIVIGIGIIAILWKKKWQGIAVVGMGVVSLILLRGENPPIGSVVAWLRSLPLVAEAFRTPYTKIAPMLTLVYAACFGYGAYALGQAWRFNIGRNLWKIFVMGGVATGLIWLNLPYFQGKLISDGVRAKISNEYFQISKFFKTQDKSSRAVRLPAYSSQAWDYTDWGYRGSGFLWYGIEQPILDRAFDVWSPYNEGFYKEFSNAMYGDNGQCDSDIVSHCHEAVEKVLQKYDVRYVLLDESVIAPGQDKEILRIEETKKLANELGWVQKFQEGFLTVWDRRLQKSQSYEPFGGGFISAPSKYSFVHADTSKVRKDVVWEDVGTYVESKSSDLSPIVTQVSELMEQGQVVYPFASLMKEEIKGAEYDSDRVTIKQNIPRELNDLNYKLVVPAFKKGEKIIVNYEVSLINGVNQVNFLPTYQIDGQDGPKIPRSISSQKLGTSGSLTLVVGEPIAEIGKNYAPSMWSEYLKDQEFRVNSDQINIVVGGTPTVYDFEKVGKQSSHNCDVLNRGSASKEGSTYSADEYGAQCDYVLMPDTNTELTYLMRVKGKNTKGLSLKTYLYNEGSGRNDSEYLLRTNLFDQTFPLLSWNFSSTYSFNIVTRSFGAKSENRLDPVEIRYFPLNELASAKIVGSSSNPAANKLKIVEVKKWGTWLYQVKVEGSGLMKLSQGYDEGWTSLGLKHVEVDGWANGWIIPSSGVATIFYWPQLLEYLGFVVLGSTVLILIFKRK